MNRASASAVLGAALAAALMVGCSTQTYHESGIVTDKEVDVECSTKSGKKGPTSTCRTELEIELARTDGTSVEIKAHSRRDFDACEIGQRFPDCVKGGK